MRGRIFDLALALTPKPLAFRFAGFLLHRALDLIALSALCFFRAGAHKALARTERWLRAIEEA